MKRATKFASFLSAAALSLLASLPAKAETPLRIGFSDWPGFTGWQIAVDKGWFKQAGVDVQMQWFDYSASLDAFSAGKLDGDFLATGDALALGANGTKNQLIMLTDYSSGNDQILAKPGITSVKQLQGQKVGVEVGLLEQMLLEHALQANGMSLDSVQLVNTVTNSTPQVLASGAVAAIGLWQPIADQARLAVPGSRAIYTSAQAPGLIYDGLAVSPQSLAARPQDWAKVIKVWYRILAYINDPKTHADALKIMAARDGVSPQIYQRYVKGTHLLSLAEAKAAFVPGTGLNSVYGSDENSDAFNVRNKVYKTPQDVKLYINGSLIDAYKEGN
ncbi:MULTISPECIES: ABC transporter substrate-binding protein [Acidocella]|uniref:ABC transporter substrate-binding protein n=1 Tax=Acidocella TaxID=50709 RepID=UPI00028C806C|nr:MULTISPECIES: ABC transporter substrate-binding protein [Acidocella]EKM99810.1 NlpA lipoprotein [Acidocella sp. MX-AZ02]WBO58440.1 ABC transporter substrate-binding protein [Acidocella sp. MX-AZ03]